MSYCDLTDINNDVIVPAYHRLRPSILLRNNHPPTMATLKPLLLAGGRSSRMGTRKELLCIEDNEPMYKRLISVLHDTCPESDTVYISLRDRSAAQALYEYGDVPCPHGDMLELNARGSTINVRVIHDNDDGNPQGENADIGPAAGLLSAHRHDPSATWLVVACDYPFLTTAALKSLRQKSKSSRASVTCFTNAEGFNEPLLAIWTTDALHTLQENVEQGILGPSAVVKRLRGRTLRPEHEQWLFNINNWEEWQQAMDMKRMN